MKKILLLVISVLLICTACSSQQQEQIEDIKKLAETYSESTDKEAFTLQVTDYLIEKALSIEEEDISNLLQSIAKLPDTETFKALKASVEVALEHEELQKWKDKFERNIEDNKLSTFMERISR